MTTNQYIWGKDISGTLQGAGGIGGLLAVSIDGAWYFPFYDNNGNITAYVDESGAIVAQYTYDAFGRTLTATGPLADAVTFRFSTKYFDPETGLYYYGYRFYSLELMRWLNRDIIGEEGGLPLYVYVLNDPLNGFDPLGLTNIKSASGNFTDAWGVQVLIQAEKGQKCSGLNFIQMLEYRVKTDPRQWQLDPTVAHAAMSPFYYWNTVQMQTVYPNYPNGIVFVDQPSIVYDLENIGEQAAFIVLVVDAWKDNKEHAEIISSFIWAYVAQVKKDPKGKDNRYQVWGMIQAATDAETDKAIGRLKGGTFDPFKTGKFEVRKSGKYKALPLAKSQKQLKDEALGLRTLYVPPWIK